MIEEWKAQRSVDAAPNHFDSQSRPRHHLAVSHYSNSLRTGGESASLVNVVTTRTKRPRQKSVPSPRSEGDPSQRSVDLSSLRQQIIGITAVPPDLCCRELTQTANAFHGFTPVSLKVSKDPNVHIRNPNDIYEGVLHGRTPLGNKPEGWQAILTSKVIPTYRKVLMVRKSFGYC